MNALAGLFFMLLWHIVDGADGDLARMTGRASPTGELVDGVCDYFGNIVMYFAFAFLADDVWGAWAWILAVGAGASHILQTNHAETQRRLYLWRAYGVPWLRNAHGRESDAVFQRKHLVHPLFRLLGGRLSLAVRPDDARAPTRSTAALARPRATRPKPGGSARWSARPMRLPCSCRSCSAPTRRPS